MKALVLREAVPCGSHRVGALKECFGKGGEHPKTKRPDGIALRRDVEM